MFSPTRSRWRVAFAVRLALLALCLTLLPGQTAAGQQPEMPSEVGPPGASSLQPTNPSSAPVLLGDVDYEPLPLTSAVSVERTAQGTPSAGTAGGWTFETVDSGVDGSIDLALDGAGNVHISYDAGGLYCARQVGDQWDYDYLVDGAYYTSIAVDQQGYEHILFFDSNTRDDTLNYVYEDGAGWHAYSFGFSGIDLGRYNDLDLTAVGQPRMLFSTWRCMMWVGGNCISWDPDQLGYMYPKDGGWEAITAGYSAEYVSLALDAGDNAHISFHNGYLNTAKYGYITLFPAGYTVDDSADVGRYSSVAVDDQYSPPRPHIAYYDATNDDLKHAYATGPDEWHLTWHRELADTSGDVGQYASLALDSEGYAHLCYYDAGNDDLKYAWQDGASWHSETVDSAGDVGRWASLAIDQENHLHVAYYDDTNDTLKYAHKPIGDGPTKHFVYLPLVIR